MGDGGTIPGASLVESLGLAMATAVVVVNLTHPIETVKTRMQVQGKEFRFGAMIKNEGVMSLFKGITAGWLREASYTTVKLGGYGPIRDALGAGDKKAPFYLKFLAGSISGSVGSVFGNPFDVMKTQMMMSKSSDSLPVFMQRMWQGQGLGGFYRGVQANIARACVLNGTKMSTYDQIKGEVVHLSGWTRDDPRCQAASAIGAGFLMTCTVAPFDMLRTTLMNQPVDKKVYNGFFDAAIKIFRNDGPLAFYRGFLPIWGRFAPQATLQLIVFEALLKLSGLKAL